MAVTRLKIDHFRWNHHEVLLRQMVVLVPRLQVQLLVSNDRPQHLEFGHRVMSGFLDPECKNNDIEFNWKMFEKK